MATHDSLEANWFESADLFDPKLIKRHNATLMGFDIGNGAKLDKINLLKEKMSLGLAELANKQAAPQANSKTMKKLAKLLKLQEAQALDQPKIKKSKKRRDRDDEDTDSLISKTDPAVGPLLARLAAVEEENRQLKNVG